MSTRELFQIWAPESSPWSVWAKPVLFVNASTGGVHVPSRWPDLHVPRRADLALVLDLPGDSSIAYALALAHKGYRPVPLFNCATGERPAIPWMPLLFRLRAGAELLAQIPLPHDAPPAFLLDSKRMSASLALVPGTFDNRWHVFPQDFPSAGFLKAHGINEVLLVQDERSAPPLQDLAHVLLRWKQAGLHLSVSSPLVTDPIPLSVPKPSRFRSIFYRIAVLAGLRRNSAGGFGAVIPFPASTTG